MDVAGHHDHLLDDLLLVKEPGEDFLQLDAEFLQLALHFFLAALLQGLLPVEIFRVHVLVGRADFFDEFAQVAQVAFAIGDLLVHDHPVKAFLRRLGQQFFRDGDVLLGRKTKAVHNAFHLQLGLFDALANLHFLLPRKQRDLAHLVHVHPDRIVQNFQACVLVLLFLRLRRLRLFGALGLGLIHDDFHVKTPQLGQQRVQILRTEIVRQHVVDVVIGDVAVLLRQMQQRPDGLGQIHGRLNGGHGSGGRMAVLRRFFRRTNRAIAVGLGLLRLGGVPTRIGNDKTPAHRRRFCRGTASAATSVIARHATRHRSFSLQHKL